jgi:hypothetical protein
LEGFCRCLQLDDGLGILPEVLPELQELTYIGKSDSDVSFTPFIIARQNEGRPLTLAHQSPAPNSSESPSEDPTITSARVNVGNYSSTIADYTQLIIMRYIMYSV